MARKCEYQLEICNHMKIFNENAFCLYDRCILLNHDLIKTENKGIKTFLDKLFRRYKCQEERK